MRKIYKYPLKVEDEQQIMMPWDAQLLTVQVQFGVLCLWALVDPVRQDAPRRILIRDTGHDASDVGRYIATFQLYSGGLVFHVFEGD